MSSSSPLLRGVLAGALVALLLPSASFAQTFSFQPYTNLTGSFIWGAVQQYLRPINRPIPYVTGYNAADFDNVWGVAQANSFLLWGCQPDVTISPDSGSTWTYISGTTASNSHMDPRDINPRFPGVQGIAVGNAGCNHRGAYNRFYLMGNAVTAPGLITQAYNVPGLQQTNLWFNWASNDGTIWNQVMGNTSSYAMTNSRTFLGGSNTQNHFCVVDQKDVVYSVGPTDTYFSNNLGVNWVKSSSVSYFSPRFGLTGGIYSPTTTQDIVITLAGTSITGPTTTGAMLNDVWSSSNGGLSWMQVTANAPWAARQVPNFAINSNGVMVVYGGDCGGGWCGVFGDAWVSVNGGSQWYLLSTAPGLNMTLTAMAFDMAGYLWLVGGQSGNVTTGNEYNWNSLVQKSSLSFSTSAITSWAPTFSGGQQFQASAITVTNAGALPMGGAKAAPTSSVPAVSQFSCALTTLPNNVGAFNLTYVDNGNGWGAIDVAVAQIAAPIVYGQPWSGNSATYDNNTGYWYGTAWTVAPTGSWVLWGTQQDVAISTNSGLSWTLIAGGGVTGEGWAQNDYDNAVLASQNLFANNAECAHRATFNRFYVIGNNGMNNATYPFEVWAANDAQVWTQVADNVTQAALAAAPFTNTVQCVVGMDDNVYFLAGSALWVSTSLGRVFTPVSSSTYFSSRQFFSAAIYAPTPTSETIVVVGGATTAAAGGYFNDVWTSTNYGGSWTQVTAAAPFDPRQGVNLAIAANGMIVFHGGAAYLSSTAAWNWYSDMWVSANGGATWVQLLASSGIARAFGGASFDPQGFFSINSGQGPNWSWNADVWKSTYSFNNIAQWAPTQAPTLSIPSALACTQGTLPTTFDMQVTSGTIPWGAIDQFVRPTQAPFSYVTYYGSDGKNQWAVAPAGSWVLWGTQPDISLSTNQGKSWTIISGTNSGSAYIDPRDLSIYPLGAGNTGCNHRTTFNRFYLLGSCNNYNCAGPYFNWATHDAAIWYEVMDNSTSYAMMARQNMTNPICVVDQQENVYYVGGADTWKSSNLGVTFTPVTASTYFTPRIQFVGGIYSPTPTTDTIVVLGGTTTTSQDVWQSTNYGAAWTQVTTSLPWSQRGNINFAIAQNGVFVAHGGDLGGGSAAEYNDVWCSLTYGKSWIALSSGGTTGTSAPGLSMAATVFDAAGYFYILGGQAFQYSWTGQQYKSTLSFLNISTWATVLSGNGAAPFSTSPLVSTTGALAQGGLTSQPTSVTVPTTSYSCSAVSSLPAYNPSTPFDIKAINTGDSWGNAGNGMAMTVAPIVYELPWTNTSYGTWEGNAWSVAPPRSFMVWGGNSDVQLSTDNGNSWTGIGGLGGGNFPGLASTSQVNFDSAGQAQALGTWNTQCGHRNTFNRFYVIGNNQLSYSAASVPFAGWASGDGLTWTEVMDNATSYAMAADQTSNKQYVSSGQCVVDIQDNVYYIGGARTWVSNNLGASFTPVTSTSYMDSATRGVRFNHAVVIFTYAPKADRILVLGGQALTAQGNGSWINDVWSTTTYGASWQQMSAAAPWTPRQNPNVAVSQDGVIVLVGGMAWVGGSTNAWVWYADSWASLNNGATWYLLSSSISSGGIAYGAIGIDSQGYVLTSGGLTPNWGWGNVVSKSTYSLNNIQQWLPAVVSSPSIPAGFCPVSTTPYTPGGGSSASSSSSGLSGGAIAGIVIGSVAGALLILLVLLIACRSAGKKKATSYETHQEQSRVANSEVEQSGHGVEMQESETA